MRALCGSLKCVFLTEQAMRRITVETFLPFLLLYSGMPVCGSVVYVDPSATGQVLDGSSWRDAYLTLQPALSAAAIPNSGITEIRVADGIFVPDTRSDANDDLSKTFTLPNGVALMGGYAGCGAPDPDARVLGSSVLSGDVERDDNCTYTSGSNCCVAHSQPIGGCSPDTPDCCEDPDCTYRVCHSGFPNAAGCCQNIWSQSCVDWAVHLCACLCASGDLEDNVYHVVTASGRGASAVLDGFTISGGHAFYPGDQADPRHLGAGLYAVAGSPTIRNCTFQKNASKGYGGAVYIENGSPVFSNCVFAENQTSARGGAVFLLNATSAPTTSIVNSVFQNNGASGSGGAIAVDNSVISLSDCQFLSNGGYVKHGGAARFDGTSTTASLIGCVFDSNSSAQDGGAVSISASSVTVRSSEFYSNSSTYGGALYIDGDGTASITDNSYFQGNHVTGRGGAVHDQGASLDIQGGELIGNWVDGEGRGGALYTENGVLSAAGATFEENYAFDGGAIWSDKTTAATISDCTIRNNGAPLGQPTITVSGGGVYIGSGLGQTLKRCRILNNKARRFGGGVYASNVVNSTLLFDNLLIAGNVAEGIEAQHGFGGGIHVA